MVKCLNFDRRSSRSEEETPRISESMYIAIVTSDNVWIEETFEADYSEAMKLNLWSEQLSHSRS